MDQKLQYDPGIRSLEYTIFGIYDLWYRLYFKSIPLCIMESRDLQDSSLPLHLLFW